jgi:D-tagatose-1,6-bisphosphate aldolase subunit GatZ/KbaZ-like
MIRVHVGAASRRVIEEAAKLQVEAIVASRSQVDVGGGYTGLDQEELVRVVEDLSGGWTQVVRDHGGPSATFADARDALRSAIDSFDEDVAAGFDRLHIDVCNVPRALQSDTLAALLRRYRGKIQVEIGGERDEQAWTDQLVELSLECGVTPQYVVVDAGGHIWADRQCGFWRAADVVDKITTRLADVGTGTKCHNADWTDAWRDYDGVVDAVNIAPEFGLVETQAWMQFLPPADTHVLLKRAYDSEAWRRWFDGENEGTWVERAMCAFRYRMVNDPEIAATLADYTDVDEQVRGRIRDAIAARG